MSVITRTALCILGLAVSSTLSGCAVALVCLVADCGAVVGNTRSFALPIESFDCSVKPRREIRLKSFELEADGAGKFAPSPLIESAEFDQDDRKNLESSFGSTLTNLDQCNAVPDLPPLEIHVVLRRHLVAMSNNAGAVLACVAWSAIADGEVIYSEEFFASDSGVLIATIGGLKNDVNRSVVQRIVQSAVFLASGSGSGRLPTVTKGTYQSFAEAAAPLPMAMTNMAPVGFTYVPGAPTGAVPWAWADPQDDIDWASRVTPATPR